jgi:cytochrome c553
MKRLLILIVGSVLGANLATAGGDPEAGKAKAQVCAGCHGPEGVSPAPNFPILAGQYEDYLLRALQEYRSGARKDPIMGGQVAALSEGDMADLAAYFARQQGLEVIDVEHADVFKTGRD